MLKEIAEVVGIHFNENDLLANQRLMRICAKLPPTANPTHPAWRAYVRKAEEDVELEGKKVFSNMVDSTIEAGIPKERVYKIKRSLKGTRIKIKSASGKSFSFGPIWIDSVKAGKGIALATPNREKLEMHAQHVGLANFTKLSSKDLASAIAAKL